MKYELNKKDQSTLSNSLPQTARKFWPLLRDQKTNIVIAFFAIVVNSVLNLLSPYLIGRAIDTSIQSGNYWGVLQTAGVLLLIYLGAFIANYIQTTSMGTVGQKLLFNLRNRIFQKLQELPVAFFNQNKVGDLISRINNDTDKLNQFFSQSLMQFVGSFFTIIGAGIFMLVIDFRLGLAALVPAAGLLVFTQIVSGWVKRRNAVSLKATGNMSAEIQESLTNFKVIVAFNRRDYFQRRFNEVNQTNFSTAVTAGIANNIFTPVYGFSSQAAQLIVLIYGIYLVSTGNFTIGLLISFFTYLSRFYDPIRQLANLWSTFQVALASWDRISEILSLKSDMKAISNPESNSVSLIEFKDVAFHYDDGKEVLSKINFKLEKGKTYALVGPTGGGKTTTASLMARLYDPSHGTVLLDGRDIRSYSDQERTQKIGFILQEPFLFSGTVKENIVYGNEEYLSFSEEQVLEKLKEANLENLIKRFRQGLSTKVTNGGENISLGQRQLIAFMRAVLRKPELLILDEATANIDTITEKLLDEILEALPKETTKVVIAHRLNTIENADEIFFVNAGNILPAGSLQKAVEMLLHHKKES